MADAPTRAERSAALEEKRRRLEDLKKRRVRRGEDTAKVKASVSSNLDEYIDGLLSQPAAVAAAAATTSKSIDTDDDEEVEEGTQQVETDDDDTKMAAADADAKSTQSAASSTGNVIAERAPALPHPRAVVAAVETFTVSTQTEPEDFPETLDSESEEEENENDKDKEFSTAGVHDKTSDAAVSRKKEKDPKLLSQQEVEKEVSSTPFSSFINTASKKVERMLGSPLLGVDLLVDYVGENDETNSRNQNNASSSNKDSDESRFVTSRQIFECPLWTRGRDITDMDWSPLHRELFLSTYHQVQSTSPAAEPAAGGGSSSSSTAPASTKGSTSSSTSAAIAVSAISPNDTLSSSLTPRNNSELQSDGLALVWSLTMPHRPEHVFTCGSPVTAGRFHSTEAPLVLGGCESGQVVVWDARAGRLPVQKSALSSLVASSSSSSSSSSARGTSSSGGKGHVHAIDGMEIIESGLGLVTSSVDGRVNFWSLSNLREPVESIQVSSSVSCFTVVPESEGLLLGDEHGNIFSAQSSSQSSGSSQRATRKQVRKLESTNEVDGENLGHYGPVTSLSAKTLKKGAASRSAGLARGFLRGSGGLVLSSGVDWTVKLWSPAYSDMPLLSMVSHSYDYMSDAKWSPNHPSVFATASCNGSVGLWNLAASLDEPITASEGLVIEPDAMLSGRGLNKLKWSTDGRRLAAASADRVHVLTLTEDIARPKGDEDTKMMNQLLSRGLLSRQ